MYLRNGTACHACASSPSARIDRRLMNDEHTVYGFGIARAVQLRVRSRLVSPGFVCALIGVVLTILAWVGPWSWPAWPAFTVLDLGVRRWFNWVEFPYGLRATVVVILIAINIAFWALAARLGWSLWMALVRRSR